MTSRELRRSFLDFFAQRDHRVLPSAPLKPSDETTLFTTAGMHPFVPWFRGLVPPAHPRVATCQKCFRADDIEQVGLTAWHCTFFEMLGNFSFGDYFKQGAIEFAWEYVTGTLGIPASRIWITVHPEDAESPEIWRRTIGVPRERIVPDTTNWWGPVGKSGPCGPDTELHLDMGESAGCGRPGCNPTCECDRFSELWNLVFQAYHKREDGSLEPLPSPGIDTGMGMERLAVLMQGVSSIFETDLLAPIMAAVLSHARTANRKLGEQLTREQALAQRIITDHVRGLAFLLADGFTPSNEGAGYVVRRVLRRAYRFGRALGLEEPFLHALVPAVVGVMGEVYPEVQGAQPRIVAWIHEEEKAFQETIARSLGPLTEAIRKAQAAGREALDGTEVFRLHDTYGLPKELAAEIAAEHGLGLDEESFARAMEQQRRRARARAEQDFAFAARCGYQGFVGRTRFLGYDACCGEGTVIGLLREGKPIERLSVGQEGEVVLDATPFYAEAGGQVGDRGRLEGPGVRVEVLDAYHPVEGAHAHRVKVVEGELTVGQRVRAQVDEDRRRAIARAHTATHLLHHVLRRTLGEHAVQSGSLVEPDRLRFDFAHFQALSLEEIQRIEEGVVALALQDEPLVAREAPLEEARAQGAIALFGEKYGERVRVVEIGGFSRELCGGTHLSRSSSIGGFAIVSEGSIGAGLRRIEAVTGKEAHAVMAQRREELAAAARALRCQPQEVPARIEALQQELRQAQRELGRLQQKSATSMAGELVAAAADVNGVKLLTARVELPPEALRGLADDLARRLGSGVVVLGSVFQGRLMFVAEVTKDLVARGYHAGNLIREVAQAAGGGGGGRPDFAQAGGRDLEQLDAALAKAKELVAGHPG